MSYTSTHSGSGYGSYSNIFGSRPNPLPVPNVQGNLQKATPNYQAMLAELTGNILGNLNGQLPMDVQNQIFDAANARAYAGGFGGSGLGRNLTLRDLGLNSLQRQDVGASQLMNFLPVQSRTATVDPALLNQINDFNSIAAALPDPAARGKWLEEQYNKTQMLQSNPAGTPWGAHGGVSYSGIGGGFGYSSPLSPAAGSFGNPFVGEAPLKWYSGTRPDNQGPYDFSALNTPTPPSTFQGFDTGGGLGAIGSQVDQILQGIG